MLVKKGVIVQAAFIGDFMAVQDTAPAVEALAGVKLRWEDVYSALQKIDIAGIFGGITLDEIMAVIFME